jgi:hypothetical protein
MMTIRLQFAFGATLACGLLLAGPSTAQMQGAGNPSYHKSGVSADGLSPEDIVALPGSPWVVAGALPHSDAGHRGGLSAIDTHDPSRIFPLYPATGATAKQDMARFKDCPGPLDAGFAPHGINIARRPDGSLEIISVNHRGRESIEFFHVDARAPVPGLTWVGCVVLPKDSSGNSVTELPDGGLIVTDFIHKPNPDFLQDMENGLATGGVLKWTPGSGWSTFTPISMSGANGAAVAPDGDWLFVSEWSDYKIWKFSLTGNTPPRSIHVNFLPDNLRLTDRGTILIAGQNADPINVMTCLRTHDPCQAPFTVLEMDPADMKTKVLVRDGDADFGGATGSAMVGSSIWISSYYSDKVVRYDPAGH